MRWKLNQILSTKAFSIVFSILAAIALWAFVDSQQGEDSSVLVQDVAVIFEGGQELEAKDMVMTAADTEKVSLRFTGDRNVITRLNNANVTVTVNLADIVSSTSGTYQLLYEVQYPEGLNVRTVKVTERSADYVGVTVEKRLQKSISIRASYDGDIAQGYSAEPLVLAQDSVVISGSQALVSKVDHAEVRFTVDKLDKTMTRELTLQLVDAAGAAVSQEGLTLSQSTVQVTLPILMVKEISLSVRLNHGNTTRTSNVMYTIYPATVTLSGDPDILHDRDTIVLDTIDLKSFSTYYEREYEIHIPEGSTNLTGDTTAVVTIQILGEEVRTYSVSNIQVRNVTEGYYAAIITQSVDVTLRGTEAYLDKITADSIWVTADLTEYGYFTGQVRVTAHITVDGTAAAHVDVIAGDSALVAVALSTTPPPPPPEQQTPEPQFPPDDTGDE